MMRGIVSFYLLFEKAPLTHSLSPKGRGNKKVFPSPRCEEWYW